MLAKLMAFHAVHGRYTSGLEYGERLLRCDNTREDIHRQMMWMYWRSGNHSAALAQYKICCQVLRDEVGAAPMELTRQLYEELLRVGSQPQAGRSGAGKIASSVISAPVPPVDLLPVAESALQQLRYLQQVLEQTNIQLMRIEQLIYQAVGARNE